MNPSLSRLLVALPLSLILSTSLVLLTWSLNKPFADNMLFNFGIIYATAMFSLMCGGTIAKIIATESHDYNQEKLDLILDGVMLTGDAKLATGSIPASPFDDVTFEYHEPSPRPMTTPERDKSLEF